MFYQQPYVTQGQFLDMLRHIRTNPFWLREWISGQFKLLFCLLTEGLKECDSANCRESRGDDSDKSRIPSSFYLFKPWLITSTNSGAFWNSGSLLLFSANMFSVHNCRNITSHFALYSSFTSNIFTSVSKFHCSQLTNRKIRISCVSRALPVVCPGAAG